MTLGVAAIAVAQQPGGAPPAPSGSAVAKATASAKASASAAASAAPTAKAGPTATTAAAPAGSGSAPATSGPAPTPPPAATASGPMDGQTYAVRLRDLEQKIDELKEQIRRSHTRLSLLSDTILSGGGSGSRAVVRFKNDLSDAFRITKALFVLDGAVQYNKTDQSGP